MDGFVDNSAKVMIIDNYCRSKLTKLWQTKNKNKYGE